MRQLSEYINESLGRIDIDVCDLDDTLQEDISVHTTTPPSIEEEEWDCFRMTYDGRMRKGTISWPDTSSNDWYGDVVSEFVVETDDLPYEPKDVKVKVKKSPHHNTGHIKRIAEIERDVRYTVCKILNALS